MQDLATLSDYAVEDAPLYERHDTAKFVVNVLLTVAIVLGIATPWSRIDEPGFWSGLWGLLAVSFILGFAVAYARFNANRRQWLWSVQRRIERIFAADPKLVPPAPPASTHRLVCAIMVSKKQAVGGILYVRQHGLTFQTNYPTTSLVRSLLRKSSKLEVDSMEIGPPGSITLHQGELRRSAVWSRLIGLPPIRVLIFRWAEGSAVFRVPLVDTVRLRLQQCLDSLRAAV